LGKLPTSAAAETFAPFIDQIATSPKTSRQRMSLWVTAPGSPLVSSIDYRNTGVILSVSPSVNVNGNVPLDISQEVSDVAANANATTLTPALSQRKIKSTITAASGQSVLLGGLISETQSRSRSGIPVLEEIHHYGTQFDVLPCEISSVLATPRPTTVLA
jgi:Flp pilus assembly secretin CpaC